MPKYFIDLKKCWGGGYAAICQNILGIWKKCWWGGGGGVMPKYFTDLKNVGGGGGVCQQIYGHEKCWGGSYAKIF